MESIIRAPALSLELRQLKKPLRHPVPPAGIPQVKQPSAQPVAQSDGMLQKEPVAAAAQRPAPTLAQQAAEREKELDRLKVQAERQGYAAGVEKAEQAIKDAIAEHMGRLSSLVESVQRAKLQALDDVEESAIAIVYAAVCKIIGEHAVTPEAVAGCVSQAVGERMQSEETVIRLHPQDAELMLQIGTGDGGTRILADPSIKFGGCVISGSKGTLDAQLDGQLSELKATLLAVRKARAATRTV